MGIREICDGQWAADRCPGDVFYSAEAARDADRNSSSASSSNSGDYTGLRAELENLKGKSIFKKSLWLLGKIFNGLWKLMDGMFK
jgi:hypothetical protein